MKQSRSFQKIHLWVALILTVSFLHSPTWAQEGSKEASAEFSTTQPRLVVQLGHAGEELNAAALSPDGRLLVTGSRDKTARLWEMATGREVQRFEGHEDRVRAVAFLPDGQFIVTVSQDKTVRLWEVNTGREVRRFVVHQPAMHAVAFSPDARFIAVAAGKTIHLWNVATGQEVRRFSLLTATLGAIAFSSDGQFMLTGESYLTNQNAAAHLWDTTTGQEVRRFTGHTKGVTTAAFSPDGRFVLTGGRDTTVRLWEVATGREVQRLTGHTGAVSGVAFSPDGKFVLTLGWDGYSEKPGALNDATVRFWDIVTGQEIQRLTGYAAKIGSNDLSANFLSNGRFIVIRGLFNWNPTLLLDTATGQEVQRLESLASRVLSIDFSPDSRWLLTGNQDGTVRLWDSTTGQEVERFTQRVDKLSSASFSPDGRLVLIRSSGGGARLWEVSTGQEVQHFPQFLVRFSPDGRFVLTGDRGTATLRDAATGRELRQFMHGSVVFALGFSPDGRFALTGGENRLACLWDTATGQQIRCFAGHTSSVDTVAFSPDGRFVLTGGWDYSENLWEVASGQLVWSVERPPNYKGEISLIRSVAFSPDGRFVVSGYSDATARLRDVTTGQEIHRFEHEGRVTFVMFSPDGRFLLTAGEDNTTRLWDPVTGQELCRLISFRDGTWVVVDREGRFDTNNLDNNRGLHWIMPDDPLTPLPLEIFMRDYYEPRLLPRILAGERFRPVRSLADLNRVQPKVQISKIEPHPTVPDAVSVTVEVAKAARKFQRGDKKVLVETGVYDLRLFRDGQLVGYAPAADGEIPVDPQTGTAVQAFTVTLPRTGNTQEVTFSAYAFNLDRVKSTTYRKIFAMPARPSPVKGRAYLISVGVNAYENSAWDLHFAANDARRLQPSLVEHLSRSAAYDDIVPITLISDSEIRDGTRVVTENRATKQNVQTVFARLAGKEIDPERAQDIPNLQKLQPVRPEDLVLISFSSHGYTDDSGNFYFLFSDIGEGSGRQITPELLQRALSSEELSWWLRDVDGGEIVLIVDACHSAATVEGAGFKPGPMGSRGLGQLAYDKGMRILTASQADDVALESDLIQQGLLTYALIHDGLEVRQADFQPQDNVITLAEWLEYGVKRVPMLYEEIKTGQVQTFGRGGDKRGVVVLSSPQSDSLKGRSSLQQPALFDFAKQQRDIVLIREQ